ncbi:MAG: HD domain-containing phosphohydrolase [Desulfovibrionaceae bacterium]
MRMLMHYAFAYVLLTFYGGQVCPFVDSLNMWRWSASLVIVFCLMYAARRMAYDAQVGRAACAARVGRLFHLDMGLYVAGGAVVAGYDFFFHGFPVGSGMKVFLGFCITGFFMAADLALELERHIATDVLCAPELVDLREGRFPLTRKFVIMTVVLALSVCAVIFLVVVKDLEWLTSDVDPNSLGQAIGPILAEIAFIMAAILAMSLNLTISFSRNLRTFFQYENTALMEVAHGNLHSAVPVATSDEFGVMAHYTNRMIDGLRVLNRELQRTQDVTILSLASLAETRDNETGQHILRTQRYVRALAGPLRTAPGYGEFLTPATIDLLFKSAPLHDIGKVGIPDAILLKPGRHTDEEFAIMKQHAVYGHEALRAAEERLGSNSFLRLAREIAISHHEKWDGSGYPNGLAGEAIPYSGRLMALADVYDALISKRVYKPSFTHEKAREIILAGRGTHFDPAVVDAFLVVEEAFKSIAAQYGDRTNGA